MPRETILVVDHSNDARQALTEVLNDEGFDVVTASSGEEALDLLERSQPALVTLDIALPGMNGLETLERFKEKRPEIPVIMLAGHATIESAFKAAKLGAYDFLVKPPELAHLILTMQKALGKEISK